MNSLENGLAIPDLLVSDRPVLRVGGVCRRLAMPQSSVSRLMKSLCRFSLIERISDDAYSVVRPRALGLAAACSGSHRLVDDADRLLDTAST
jgi:DNA-binding IclR family transcriptional regulator